MCTQTRLAEGHRWADPTHRRQSAWGRVCVTGWRNREEGREVRGPHLRGPLGPKNVLLRAASSKCLCKEKGN